MKRSSHLFFWALLATTGYPPDAGAYTVAITPAARSLYLRVGNGAFNGTYSNNGTPAALATVNLVSVAVPAVSIGNGAAQVMTTNTTSGASFYDGFAFCDIPTEVYVGGYMRRPGNTAGNGSLTVTAPANLTNAGGDTIPISEISWTSAGNGDTGAQPFPAGSFTGGTQTLATFPINTWRESCHTFSYENNQIVASGTYTARVTYTLSMP